MTLSYTFTILGAPCSYKNSKEIVHPRGKASRPWLQPSKKSQKWMKSAVKQLQEQWGGRPRIPKSTELNAAIVSYLPTRRLTDADNLYGGPGDALQRAGILEDDCCIRTNDGSDRRYDKNNPRVVITLTKCDRPPWDGQEVMF
jgi:Holliday junction resolvase RusA-like endonuclease